MALAVPHQSTGTGSVPSTQQMLSPAAGSWLVAVVAVNTNDGTVPSMCVSDYAANLWTLVYSGKATAEVHNGSLFTQVWVAPAVQYAGWPQLGVYVSMLYASATDTASFAANVFEVTGMGNGFLTVDSVTTATATSATTISVTTPTPTSSANCLMVSVANGSNNSATYTVTSGGWNALTVAGNSAPDVHAVPLWRESTATQTATWTSSVAVNWTAVAVAIRVTGIAPSQPNPKFPALDFQLGLGWDLSTPVNAITWTSLPDRLSKFQTQRGLQYELGKVQSWPTDLELRNDDGALTPRANLNNGGLPAVANGTTTTIVVSNTDGALVTLGDFFTLYGPTGVLKEVNVFQVTAIAVATNTTITFKRADGTVGGAQTSTATNDAFFGTPIDVYVPYRIMATWGSARYPVVVGWVERWPSQWDDPHWGTIQAVGVDTIATMTAADVTPVRGEIMLRRPSQYWPCNDPAGSSAALDQSGYNSVSLVPTGSSNGAGAGSNAFGVSTQAVPTGSTAQYGPFSAASIIGDTGTGWGVAGLAAADITAGDGFALKAAPGNNTTFPSITNGVTIFGTMMWDNTAIVNNPGTGVNIANTVLIIRSSSGTGAAATILKLSVIPSGGNVNRMQVTVWDKTSHASTTTQITSGSAQGWQFIDWAISFDQTHWTYYGQSASTMVSQSGTCNLPTSFGLLEVGGEADTTTNGNCQNGIFAHIAVFPRRLSAGEIGAIHNATYQGQYPFFATNDAISHKLSFVDWVGHRALNYTSYDTGSDITTGMSVAEKITDMAGYEGGTLFSDATGGLQFRGVDTAATQTSRATVGDRPDLGEIPYLGDSSNLTVDYDPTFIYNTITVSNTGVVVTWDPGAKVQIQRAVDNTSVLRYGTRTLTVTTNLANSNDVTNLLNTLTDKYKAPHLRVSSVTIDVLTSQQFTFALSVEVGDVVTFVRRPIGAAATITIVCVVLSVQHTVDPPNQWDLVLTLAPQ